MVKLNLDRFIDEPDEDDEKSFKKRFFLIVGSLVGLIALFVGGFILIDNLVSPTNSEIATHELTDREKASLEVTVDSFMRSAGDFGFARDVHESSTEELLAIRDALSNESLDSSTFYLSRGNAYGYLAESYILPESEVWFSEREVASWDSRFEVPTFNSYELTDLDFELPSRGSDILIEETEYVSVDVPVKFTTQITRALTTQNEAGEISLTPQVKTLTDEGKLTLVLSAGEWKVTNLETTYPVVFATWSPDETIYNGFAINEIGSETP